MPVNPTLSLLFSKLKFLSLAAQTLGYYYVSLLLKYRFGETRFSLRAIYLEMSMLFREYCYATSTNLRLLQKNHKDQILKHESMQILNIYLLLPFNFIQFECFFCFFFWIFYFSLCSTVLQCCEQPWQMQSSLVIFKAFKFKLGVAHPSCIYQYSSSLFLSIPIPQR